MRTPDRLDSRKSLFAALEKEHERVDALLDTLAETLDRPPTRSRETALDETLAAVDGSLRDLLDREERSIYAWLTGAGTASSLTRQALRQHGELRRLLDEIRTAEEGSPERIRTCRALHWAVEDHFEYEENDVFEALSKRINPVRARELMDELRARA